MSGCRDWLERVLCTRRKTGCRSKSCALSRDRMLKNQKEKELKKHQLNKENPDWGAWDVKEQIQITMLEIEMKKSATICSFSSPAPKSGFSSFSWD